MTDLVETLTPQEMVDWANASLDRIEELEAEMAHREKLSSKRCARIAELEADLKIFRQHYADHVREIQRLQARVEALEKVRKAVLKHRDNKAFLNIDTWNACVYAAEAATEQGESDGT